MSERGQAPAKLTPKVPSSALSDEQLRQDEQDRAAEMYERSRVDRMNRWVKRRGDRYRSCTLDTFSARTDEQKQAVERLQAIDLTAAFAMGRNLVFYGPRGTGKDHLLAAMVKRLIASVRIPHEANGVRTFRAPNAEWINGVSLFADYRDKMQKSTEREALSAYLGVDVFCISDPVPPVGKLTEFQMQVLFRILDSRYSNCRPVWATINVQDGDELDERLGPQLADRLRDGAISIPCNWPSYRKASR